MTTVGGKLIFGKKRLMTSLNDKLSLMNAKEITHNSITSFN
jgi:hypothetical protein